MDKAYSMIIRCQTNDKQTIESSATCSENIKFALGGPMVKLKEPLAGNATKSQEHSILIECQPGQPTTLEAILSKTGAEQ